MPKFDQIPRSVPPSFIEQPRPTEFQKPAASFPQQLSEVKLSRPAEEFPSKSRYDPAF